MVHRAALELVTADGSTYVYDAVIKIAFSTEQQSKLRYEYSIFAHLARSGVTSGIPTVLGLFEDMEGGPVVMIMNYGGRHLNETRATEDEWFDSRRFFAHPRTNSVLVQVSGIQSSRSTVLG